MGAQPNAVAERAPDDLKTLRDQWRTKHGDTVECTPRLRSGKQLLIFRPFTPEEFDNLREALQNNKKSDSAAYRQACFFTRLYPSGDRGRDELKAVFDEKPALAARICETLGDLAGTEVEIEIKKA